MDITTLRRSLIANTPHLETASGTDFHLFKAALAKMPQCVIGFEPVQAGSGDPSPNNIRNLSGYDGVDLYVSPTQTAADGTTYSISWPSQGTLYGGTVDLINGTLKQTHAYALYTGESAEAWKVENSNNFYIMTPSTWIRNTSWSTMFCNLAISFQSVGTGTCKITNSGNFNINIGSIIGIHTVAGFKEYLASHPLQVVCTLQSPVTYQLTGQTIKTLAGENYIWSNANRNINIKYWTM